MERQIEVTGAEQSGRPPATWRRRDSGWTLLAAGAIGVLVGAAAVSLLTPVEPTTETTVAQEDTSLEAPPVVVATPATVRPPPTLAERVPGLTSDLVAFGFTPSGQAVIQQWFINAIEPRTIDVPFGRAIADTSGQWIAALVSQRYGDSSNLHIGNSAYQEAVATDVGSAVWSADQPGRIVWTERTAAGTIAFEQTMGRDIVLQPFAIPVPDDASVVWLERDRLTITSGGSIISLQPDGSEAARLAGAEFVAATDGWAVVWVDESLTLVDRDLVPSAPIPAGDGLCSDARFARADSRRAPSLRLAVLCGTATSTRVEVLDIDPTALTFTSRAGIDLAKPGAMSWLDGDRFVAVPQPDPVSRPRSVIAILDIETGEVTQLQWPGALFGVIGTR